MHKVGILAFDQMPLFELACAVEVFALPRPELSQWYDTQIVALQPGALRTTAGLDIKGGNSGALQQFDTLIIPGWPVDKRTLKVTLAEQLSDFHAAGKRLVAFCSGAFLLAMTGLLNGRPATTHWRYADAFTARFPAVDYRDNVLYTMQDNLCCSAGSAAALDLALELVRQDFGHQVANMVARRLVIPPHRKGGQNQFVETPLPPQHNAFSATLDWARGQIHKPLVVDDLAHKANMSRRSFDRHFRAVVGMSPKSWLNQQRVEQARQILELESVTMDTLAQRVGFDNAITLRFNFNKYVGIAPSQYQQQFAAQRLPS